MQKGMLAEMQLDVAIEGMIEGMTAVTEAGVMIPEDGMMTVATADVTDHLGVSLTGISMTTGTDKMTTGVTGLVLGSLKLARELRSWMLKWMTLRNRCVSQMHLHNVQTNEH